MSIVHEMLVHGFSLPFYKLLQEMPMCGVFLITRDFHITIKEDKKIDSCNASTLATLKLHLISVFILDIIPNPSRS